MQQVLPLLYYKETLLPETEPVYDENNEQFVTEGDYYSTIEGKVMITYLVSITSSLRLTIPRADELTGLYTASIANT
jgi:hypothetical protein